MQTDRGRRYYAVLNLQNDSKGAKLMKKIETVGIVGLGALGVLYADTLTRALGKERVRILADAARTARYQESGIYFNGEPCDFQYADAAKETAPCDLLLFAVKFGGLESAIAECGHLVGPDTIVVSILNGILAEQVLSDAFGADKLVWCIAQKMSAMKEGNRAFADPKGELAIGVPAGVDEGNLRALIAFFDSIHFPYSLPDDIRRAKWSKLLCNTGCNQSTMVFEGGYGILQKPGKPRDTMLGAMREVVAVANAEGIDLTEQDVRDWVAIIDVFPPDGEPSMRQDGKAHRKSEVELFAGTIRRLAAKHGIAVPVNDWLYAQVQQMEQTY
jgi:2-dehydropantoate 2-reductase